VFAVVHWTHVLDVVSHAGVEPEQSASLAHCAHLFEFGPAVAQIIERQTVAPVPASPGEQLPSPLA
jgi:hypothetical protein